MDINPSRSNRIMKAERAHRQHVVLTHNPSSIEPGQTLQVRFPNLGDHDVIAPGSFFISFALNLKGKKDEARSVVPNIGRKIIKTFKIYFEGNEVLSISNYDEISTYMDFWLSKKDKARRVFQGIDDADALKLRVASKGATGDAGKTAVAKTFGNRFRIPIDFELLNDIGPYHQASLTDKLEVKLTFNDSKAIILGIFTENGVTLRDYLTEKYALGLDLRPSTDSSLHGNGARLENTSEGVTLEIHRVAGTGNGKLNLHVFVFQDCQLNILGGRFHSIEA